MATVFFVAHAIWSTKPDKHNDRNYPDNVSLPDGSLLCITDYPKYKSLNDIPEKGIYKDDLIICDPEQYAKLHLHDTVVHKNSNIYVIDTCHKDGTYTLKRTGEKLERQDRKDIVLVARYTIKYPYDDVVNVIL
jgi:hypothetical protein